MCVLQLYAVEDYTLTTRDGRKIRRATRVRRADGKVLAFTERMPKGEAIRQAAALPERVWVSQ